MERGENDAPRGCDKSFKSAEPNFMVELLSASMRFLRPGKSTQAVFPIGTPTKIDRDSYVI